MNIFGEAIKAFFIGSIPLFTGILPLLAAFLLCKRLCGGSFVTN